MSTGSDAADQMVKETVYFTAEAAKLVGVGAKNLAALMLAMAKDMEKVKGKTNILTLLKQTSQPKVVRIKMDDLTFFKRNAGKYGVQFAAVRDKHCVDGLCDVIVPVEKISAVNRILEKMGYPVPTKEEEEKNGKSAVRSGRNLNARETAAKQTDSIKDAISGRDQKPKEEQGGYGSRLAAIKKRSRPTKAPAEPER